MTGYVYVYLYCQLEVCFVEHDRLHKNVCTLYQAYQQLVACKSIFSQKGKLMLNLSLLRNHTHMSLFE